MANQITVNSGTGNITVTTSRSVIGTVSTATTANTVINNAQPNITSVGTLTGLTSSGNITAPYFIGNIVGNISGNIVVPGTNTSVLFNQVGSAGASDALQFDYSANVLKVTGNANVTGKLTLGGNVEGNLLPQANGTQDIGSNTQRWNDLYLNGNTIYLGQQTLESNATHTIISGVLSANGAGLTNVSAASANSIAVGNVTGIGNIATVNLDGNASNVLRGDGTFSAEAGNLNANYANFAGTAFSVSGSNVSGAVANATYADSANTANTANIANSATVANSANSVAGANVTGTVANATFATTAGSANTANSATVAASANSVAGANVSGQVANANVSYYSNISNNNTLANTYPVFANSSGLQQLLIDPTGTPLVYNPGLGRLYADSFEGGTVLLNNQITAPNITANTGIFTGNGAGLTNIPGANVTGTVANANNSAYAGNITVNAQPNITSVGTLTSLTVSGNIVGQSNVYVSDTLVFANTVQVTSPGYYLPYGFTFTGGSPNTSVLYTINVQGDVTNGSNVVSNVAIYDTSSGSPLNLSNYAPLLANLSLIPVFTQSVGYYDSALPDLGTISNVDAGNSTITYSNNFTDTKTVNILTGIIAYNTSNDTYFGMRRSLFATALSTDSSNNQITLDTIDPIDQGVGVGAEIKFVGTSFGNISANTSYYIDSIDVGNVAITISETQGGPVHSLTTATGTMYIVNPNADGVTIRTDLDTFYAGPWDTVPTYANLSVTTNPNFATTPVINVGYSKPVNYNDNPPNQIPGGFVSQIQYNQLVGPTVVGTKGAPTLSGTLQDGFGLNGITAINDGTDANLTGLRTSFATISYSNGGSDNASITNPGNPTGFQMSSFTGNSQTAPEDQYLRSGRALGRIAFYASQRVNGQFYANPGTSPYAGIYAQALGDWSSDVNTSLPMVMAFQYTPLNAATGAGSDYQRINRTFLQAANNTTSIGGATNIEFKPLARSTNGTNNRSPSALGNVSINPQTFVDIRGYTAGNAVSNGAGAVLNVTTTASSWNGNVALRLSRTVGNTANMEFRLPTASANTMLLVDNASGNTIATFTNGYANVTGEINATGRINNYLRTFGSFINTNDIAITANTVANLDLPTTGSANGISIASNNQITIERAGTYNFQFSLQLTNSDNAAEHEFDVWFAKNGTDIANSATTYTVIKNNGKNVAALNFIDTCNANDYYQIRYAASSANVSLESFGAITTPYNRPAIPSAIVTVVPVGA